MFSVLVADDEPLERQGIRHLLDGTRYRVVAEARNGLESVSLSRELQPDIVIMDIKMPGLDGLGAVRSIRTFLPQAAVIILTAYDEFEYAQEALKLGVSDFVLKPARPEELMAALERAAAAVGTQRARTEEERRLREQLRTFVPFVRLGLAYALLNGTVTDVRTLIEQAEFLGVCPLPSVVMLIDIDGFGEYARDRNETCRQALKQKVWKAIGTIVAQYPGSTTVPLHEDEFAVLLAVPPGIPRGSEEEVGAILRAAEAARAAVEAGTEVTVVVGVGSPASDAKDLSRSYWEAVQACRVGAFFLGPNRVVHWREIKPLVVPGIPAETGRAVAEWVQRGDRAGVERFLLEFLNALLARVPGEPERVKMGLLEALVMASRAVGDVGIPPRDVANFNLDLVARLVSCDTREDLETWCREAARLYATTVNEAYRSFTREAVDKALRYLQENYTRDFSVQELAKRVLFMHPDYFSRVFKRDTGYSFVEYRTRLRLQMAKALLRRGDLTVAEVAARVGYSDPNYFSRVFARVEGKPPRDWRRSVPAASTTVHAADTTELS